MSTRADVGKKFGKELEDDAGVGAGSIESVCTVDRDDARLWDFWGRFTACRLVDGWAYLSDRFPGSEVN